MSFKDFFAHSPAAQLLRRPNASWLIEFFVEQFKERAEPVRKHGELVALISESLISGSRSALEREMDEAAADTALLESVIESPGERSEHGKLDHGKAAQKATELLNKWSSRDCGWLKRFVQDDVDEPQYQLTPATEQAIAFVLSASRSGQLVGTESRLKTILRLLDEVRTGADDDPKAAIARLQQQRDEIDREILRLENGDPAPQLRPHQIRERFQFAIEQLEQLKSEFRGVEEQFREITRQVQRRIVSEEETRGEILQYALDCEDALKKSPQGSSFYEFLRMVHSPSQQDRLNRLVSDLVHFGDLHAQPDELESLKSMVPTLIREAEKILKTTQQLSQTLRRLLESRSSKRHKQLANVLRDILGNVESISADRRSDIYLEVETDLDIISPMDRPFWCGAEPFEEVGLAEAVVDASEQAMLLEQIAALERIDWQQMRRNVSLATTDKGVELSEFLERFPLESGTMELLGYIQIAFDDGHEIDLEHSKVILLDGYGMTARALRVPTIRFLPARSRHAHRDMQSSAEIDPSQSLARS